jgi:hypothetical protein
VRNSDVSLTALVGSPNIGDETKSIKPVTGKELMLRKKAGR